MLIPVSVMVESKKNREMESIAMINKDPVVQTVPSVKTLDSLKELRTLGNPLGCHRVRCKTGLSSFLGLLLLLNEQVPEDIQCYRAQCGHLYVLWFQGLFFVIFFVLVVRTFYSF